MSLEETKEHLLTLLGDPENKVIALSGKWGTGKTHLWGEVIKESRDETVNGALYVSLFGLSSIDQVKRKLIESVAPGAEAHPKIWEAAKQAVNSGLKVLEGFHKGFAALSDLNLLLLAPVMLREKVIVIDDIERKHEKLGIDEILGFIDEYTQRHKARFVLVLNSDQLAKREVWDTLREKVIDQELRLLTTPEEAFSIAVRLFQSRHADSIKRASVACGLTNIRIIGKVIKASNRILGDRSLEDALLARVVPSIVLFAAIHYRGLEDGPDFQFALKIGSPDDWGDFIKDENEEPTEEEKRRAKWRLLMNELGINGCDEFEGLVVEFLESGLFDASKVTPIIDRYVAEKQKVEAHEKANQFMYKVMWDHRLNNAQLLEMATELAAVAGLLDPYVCSELVIALAEIPGGAHIGQAIVDGWIANFRAQKLEYVNDYNPFNRPLHNAIAAEFATVNAQAQARTTVLDACMHIIEERGWGTAQEVAMKGATAADFELAIRTMEIETLRRFMRRMIEMRLQRQSYDPHFGMATERFVEACRTIANDPTSSRLAGLVTFLFARTALASELALPPAQGSPATAQAAHAAVAPGS
ncbi:MAG: P-loop NTPase fold protein [Rubrivivax sp.]|nr:P-loop NTPase fold protein [Rubrivivax sp.]